MYVCMHVCPIQVAIPGHQLLRVIGMTLLYMLPGVPDSFVHIIGFSVEGSVPVGGRDKKALLLSVVC